MAAIDPTTVRLSDNFLLSDFMGCDSVYRLGYANAISNSKADAAKIAQGMELAKHLDEMMMSFGYMSVTYGYISPSLSRKIVRYQDPDKPSYHRWDLGAAADFCLHEWYSEMATELANPIGLVRHLCFSEYEFDRIITYSESDIVCYATSTLHDPMNKVYENRYTGVPKPRFIKYPTNNDKARDKMLADAIAEVSGTWRGRGYPSHHGGGRKQYEHHRIGRYTLLSDFLYSAQKVHSGVPNRPPEGDKASEVLSTAATLNDKLIALWSDRSAKPTIVAAIDCNTRPWTERFVIDYVPSGAYMNNVDEAYSLSCKAASPYGFVDDVKIIKMKRGETRIRVIGSKV